MGSLLIDIGQCGNQIGLQLLDYFDQTSGQYEDSYLKRQDYNLYHSIHIDTEPKIIKPITENRKKYSYINSKNVLYLQNGRGNNWCLGYMDEQKLIQRQQQQKKDEIEVKFNKFSENKIQYKNVQKINVNNNILKENTQMIENSTEIIRKEIERTDYFIGINMISSIGGGTGSGFGSRLLQEMREIFEDIELINTIVFPNKSGESTLQHYNCALSLSYMQEYSDCIIYFQNDKINTYLNYSQSKSVEKVIDLNNINQYIASNILNLMRINDYKNFNRFYFDILMDTAPMNDMKFVEIYSTPYYYNKTQSTGPECKWEKTLDCLLSQVNVDYQNQIVSTKDNEDNCGFEYDFMKNEQKKDVSITTQCILRGGDVQKNVKQNESLMKYINRKIVQTFNPVLWNCDNINYEYINEKANEGIDYKMILAISNRSNIAGIIQNINDIAQQKFKANAYLHWYYQYGLERSDFENSFLVLDNICNSYNNLKI
ncbi:hypothetical protein IMG5_010880 [Ichthyophthirius multifiliis]|uniref:Tubulin delta chain n=1 Tax=Ichthyophthirius multifiliis TaxID=5932 RepID=G0QK01_ICHMU|nr:hypothetical protein IMG5_010880 [Ichthyophthirius multifiliis]EGR34461.1 hypothetical protein IMG5_010880 [Ichthyophthirius multifiliis]|eukprot:XP_004039765.1 hypothetical protein IMG5_010880 [Ichthyophthirius multifiliis]